MHCAAPASSTHLRVTDGCWPADLQGKIGGRQAYRKSCGLHDHDRELADQLSDLFKLGIVVVIDAVREPLDTFVIAEGRANQVIIGLRVGLHLRAPRVPATPD